MVTSYGLQDQRGIFHTPCQRPHAVQGRSIRYQAVAGDTPIGGLDANHATKVCWLADAATCTASQLWSSRTCLSFAALDASGRDGDAMQRSHKLSKGARH